MKLLALDLDGTLLDDGGRVHPEDAAAIARAKAAGLAVTVVTGRLYSGTRESARAIGALGPVACVDGTHIVEAGTDRDLVHRSVAGHAAEAVREASARAKVACFLFAHDEIVFDEHGERFVPYVRLWSARMVRHHRATEHPHWGHPRGVSAVVCVGPEEGIRHAAAQVEGAGGAFVAAFPVRRAEVEPVWGMVVRAAGHDKGTAVGWLAQHYGCGPEEVAAVGDWLNDVPMFAVAGRSFAMGQAPDVVKAAAGEVLSATSATGGGVAEALRRLGLVR
ncbi:MAG TPA: HAD family hydrolase [Polyangiaceae bacterium]|nr:HAD family hydrolase [Polyangiaceae bacterium]